MESISNCPRRGNHCSLCIEVSAEEFADELRAGGIDEKTVQNYRGDAKLAGQIEDQGGVEALSCDQRRARARIIGRRAGEALVYRSQSPGDN